MSQSGTILHLFGWDKKFFLPFRDLIQANFADSRHQFIVYGRVADSDLKPSTNTVIYSSLLKNFFALSKALNHAEKIILHGLFSTHLLYILALQPWLLKKCYWVMWGGDLYVHQDPLKNLRWKKNEIVRSFVIKRVGYLLSYIHGDAELARKWYGARGKYLECLMYPSNLYKEYSVPPKTGHGTNILVGNSADPTNNHAEVFEKLAKYENEDILIYCPLSYGDVQYAEKVIKQGQNLFGDKFIPLLEFMPFDQYLKLLGQIDVAIFAHKRQQGMGNTITLLGLGKKIYMRADVTPWAMFKEVGAEVYSIAEINLVPMDEKACTRNRSIISNHFSDQNLIVQLKKIFER